MIHCSSSEDINNVNRQTNVNTQGTDSTPNSNMQRNTHTQTVSPLDRARECNVNVQTNTNSKMTPPITDNPRNPHIVELEEDVDSDDTITQKDIKQINFDIAGWLRSQH